MIKIFVMTISLFVLSACQTTGKNIKYISQTGYSAESLQYKPSSKTSENIVFIIMHGKSGKPSSPFRLELYPKLTKNGYEVIAPKMPWSYEWNGTPDDGISLIDEIISDVASRGKKVVLVGHSLGGANALIYASRKPRSEVLGVITVAPGHMLHKSSRLQRVTESSVEKARSMVRDGKGDEKSYFTEVNTGKVKGVRMRALTYLSYYDIEKFPDVEELLPNIKLPVLWIAGDADRLTSIYNMEFLFESLPENAKNKYLEVNGGHKSVLPNSASVMVDWASKL